MKTIESTVKFITPAFLGNAEQQGAWRSPPFKALLRQWWRVVVAHQYNYDHSEMREAEGRLFGHAWLQEKGKSWACQSKVRIKLKHWDGGHLQSWSSEPKVKHPEVKFPVGAHLYLGYGPIGYEKGKGTCLKYPPAIDANAENRLLVAFPDNEADSMKKTIQLMHWFGTMGSRSRNGWGSVSLAAKPLLDTDALLKGGSTLKLQAHSRPLMDCLGQEWPHAFGADKRGLLIWKTQPCQDWSAAQKLLAEVKIAFRTDLKFNGPSGPFMPRHLLAYPVTKHSVREWGNQKRLANQLRFKVIQQSDGSYVGLAFHLPCAIPNELMEKLEQGTRKKLTTAYQMSVWEQVHHVLDMKMTRIPGGSA